MTTDVVTALGAGALAGLGVALPLGAIGVLIIQEGITGGWRPAAAAGLGVGLVDGAYAAVAVAAGAAVTRALAGSERAVQLVGAIVLATVAARGIARLRRPQEPGVPVPRGRVLRRFVALTAVNPMTAVYFVVLTAGLGRVVSGPTAGIAFAAGVLIASCVWQLTLAGAAALAGARLPRRLRLATGVAGYLLVAAYAVRLAVG
ncbi:MAG TPA: LysE family transporter [Kineosporiaceae bacterium]|nr:LysE family transporter [Kineosporiaceae bacterium]